jgi:hypothetical protein
MIAPRIKDIRPNPTQDEGRARGATCFCLQKKEDLILVITGQPALLRFKGIPARATCPIQLDNRVGTIGFFYRLAPDAGSLIEKGNLFPG